MPSKISPTPTKSKKLLAACAIQDGDRVQWSNGEGSTLVGTVWSRRVSAIDGETVMVKVKVPGLRCNPLEFKEETLELMEGES